MKFRKLYAGSPQDNGIFVLRFGGCLTRNALLAPYYVYPVWEMQDISHRLRKLLTLLNDSLADFSEAELAVKPGPGRWSKKELLGHLIDSAANNHRRFIMSQLQPEPLLIIAYDQDQWVALSRYQHSPAAELLQFWTLYNLQIVRLLEHLPPAAATHRCQFDNGYGVTLRWLAEDYLVHLEHHVHQLLTPASL